MEKLIATVCGNEVLIFGGSQKLFQYREATRGAALNVANDFDALSAVAQRRSVGLPETWTPITLPSMGSLLQAKAARRLGWNAEQNRKNRAWYDGRKPECAPNRKAGARLKARQHDWQVMVDGPQWRGNVAAYHKPGSMQ